MDEAERAEQLRDRFLSVAYDLTVNRSMPFVRIMEVGCELGLPADRATLMNPASEINGLARYWANKGCIRSQTYGYETFSLTSEGMAEAEGQNRRETFNTTFNVYGDVQGSVIGTHNKAELTNTFDFGAIERRIEEEGGEDKEELRQALEQVRRLIERGNYLDRGALAQFSGAMEKHSWFTGSIMQALLGFATQAAG